MNGSTPIVPSRILDDLAREFGAWFDFTVTKVRDHLSLTALRRNMSEPGVCAVMTADAAEMTEVLRADQLDEHAVSPP